MKVTNFGKALWDDSPNGEVLGGTPLNVAVRLQSLGIDAIIISRCGDDADDEELLRQVQGRDISTDYLQVCQECATSLVKVHLGKSGSASYKIAYPCAWDGILNDNVAIKRVAESNAFVSDSLTTRDEILRKSLSVLLKEVKSKIPDVNLCRPHCDTDCLLEAVKQSDMAKLDDDELYELAAAYGSPYHSIEQNIDYLVKLAGAEVLYVTLGSHGAVLYKDGEVYRHRGFRAKVVDTVGSGDGFLGGLAYKLFNNAPLQETIIFACALDALVASRHGITADVSLEEAEAFINPA